MLTDRQRWNWHAADNALQAMIKLNRMNTASVCDGKPFLSPEERRSVEVQIHWLEGICAELEQNRRSREGDIIRLVTATHEADHSGPMTSQPDQPTPEAIT